MLKPSPTSQFISPTSLQIVALHPSLTTIGREGFIHNLLYPTRGQTRCSNLEMRQRFFSGINLYTQPCTIRSRGVTSRIILTYGSTNENIQKSFTIIIGRKSRKRNPYRYPGGFVIIRELQCSMKRSIEDPVDLTNIPRQSFCEIGLISYTYKHVPWPSHRRDNRSGRKTPTIVNKCTDCIQ